MGENTLATMMSRMAKKAGLVGKLTNHSLRRTSLTTLMQAGVPPTIVAQFSGHKNIGSLNRYTTASLKQQRMMSDILQSCPNKRTKFVNKSTKNDENERPALQEISNMQPVQNPPSSNNQVAPLQNPPRALDFSASPDRPNVPLMSSISSMHQLTSSIFYGANIGSIGTVNINISK